MINELKINNALTISGQPTPQELQGLEARGFHAVVNLRDPDEQGFLDEEERIVKDAGLNYVSIPVSPQNLDDGDVQRLTQELGSVDGTPALIHCKGGGRAGILALLSMAVDHGWSIAQALEAGRKLNIAPADDSPYRAFFEEYLKRHSPAER